MKTRKWTPKLPASWPCQKCSERFSDMPEFIRHLSTAHPELAEGPLMKED